MMNRNILIAIVITIVFIILLVVFIPSNSTPPGGCEMRRETNKNRIEPENVSENFTPTQEANKDRSAKSRSMKATLRKQSSKLPKIDESSQEDRIVTMKCDDKGECKGSISSITGHIPPLVPTFDSSISKEKAGPYMVTFVIDSTNSNSSDRFLASSHLVDGKLTIDGGVDIPHTIEIDCRLCGEQSLSLQHEPKEFFSGVD